MRINIAVFQQYWFDECRLAKVLKEKIKDMKQKEFILNKEIIMNKEFIMKQKIEGTFLDELLDCLIMGKIKIKNFLKFLDIIEKNNFDRKFISEEFCQYLEEQLNTIGYSTNDIYRDIVTSLKRMF